MTARRLSEILQASTKDRLAKAFGETQPAPDFVPLPSGEYKARVTAGELFASRNKGTAGYKLTFEVAEGEFEGRRFWCDIWLTEAALPMAKRDLGKLGVTSLEQLERPLPQGIVCTAKLVLRREDDGLEHNRVVRFDVIGIEKPEPDAFAPEPPLPIEGTGDSDPGGTGEGTSTAS